MRKPVYAVLSAFLLLAITVLGAEVVVYLSVCASLNLVDSPYNTGMIDTVISAPAVKFDPLLGFRWRPGSSRIMRVINKEVVFDYEFTMNRQGFHSKRDYQYRKPQGTYRVIVLGDSFTNEIYQDPWIDTMNSMSKTQNKNIEWYAFGIEGGGLHNWHQIFFKEIVPNYEFDAVVLAGYEDNLGRGFTIFDATEAHIAIGRFPDTPKSNADFQKNFRPRMGNGMKIVPAEKFSGLKRDLTSFNFEWRPLRAYLTRYLVKKIFSDSSSKSNRGAFEYTAEMTPARVFETARQKYSAKYMEFLTQIAWYCRKNNRRIILASVPDRDLLRSYLGKPHPLNRHQLEFIGLAKYLGIEYFDGYRVFDDIHKSRVPEMYLKYDGHWSYPGATRFAEKFHAYFTSTQN